MKLDIQLVAECELLIPKLGLDSSHVLQSHLNWYQGCMKRKQFEEANIYATWLHRDLIRAKKELAEQAMKQHE